MQISNRFQASLIVAVFVSLIGNVAAADEKDEIQVVPYTMIEDVVYGHKDGMALTLDVVKPTKNPKGLGLVLVSSGGWRSDKSDVPEKHKKRLEEEHWVQGLLQGGYTLFVARHGSAPRYFVPEMVEDIRRSVRFVHLRGADYGIDPDRLGITSGSSGGHLSLMVGMTGDDGKPDASDPIERGSSRVQAVVAWFPPTDLINWMSPNGYKTIEKLRPTLFPEIFGKITNIEEQLRSISPIYFVSTDDPPLLLIHGDRDLTVPVQQSKILKTKYEETGLPVELIVQKGGGHTYWPGIMEQYPKVWEFFDKHLVEPKEAASTQ
ncbi:MAG: alpha/beta hydrolase [Planctomycetota bacterium]